MALSTLARVKRLAGVEDSSQDTLLTDILEGASDAIEGYLNRVIATATYTEFYSGNGQPALRLRQTPVTSITSVYLDAAGFWGQGTNAFASTTLLTSGTDYAYELKSSSNSITGLLVRLSLGSSGDWGWTGSGMGGIPWGGGGIGWAGTLTGGRGGPVWPRGQGNLKVVYVAGYSSTPDDIMLACDEVCAWVLKAGPHGGQGMVGSESFRSYSYSISAQGVGAAPELGGVRQMLAPYRRLDALVG